MTLVDQLRARAAGEEGYTIVELLTVLAVLGTVVATLTTLFVSASKAELEMNERFQAQQEARLALSRLRREIHCAKAADGTTTALTLTPSSSTPGTYCSAPETTWCTEPLGESRYALFRNEGTSCDATALKVADYLTTADVFTYSPRTPETRATVNVDLQVDLLDDGRSAYHLADRIAMRRSGRA